MIKIKLNGKQIVIRFISEVTIIIQRRNTYRNMQRYRYFKARFNNVLFSRNLNQNMSYIALFL